MPSIELTTLARRIADAIPDDGYEQTAILQQFYQLYDSLLTGRREAMARRLDAGAVLLEVLETTGTLAPETVFEVLGALVESVRREVESESVGAALPKPNVEAAPPPIASASVTAPKPVEPPQSKAPPEPSTPLRLASDPLDMHLDDVAKEPPPAAPANSSLRLASEPLGTARGAEDPPPPPGTKKAARGPKGTAPAGPARDTGMDSLLGRILENLGVVTAEQLERALEIQRESGTRLGDALIRIGAASVKHVERALKIQHHLRFGTMERKPPETKAAPPDRRKLEAAIHSREEERLPNLEISKGTLIGEIFIQLGLAYRDQVEGALKVQRATGLRLGEVLVEMGVVNWNQVEKAQEAQRRLRNLPGVQA